MRPSKPNDYIWVIKGITHPISRDQGLTVHSFTLLDGPVGHSLLPCAVCPGGAALRWAPGKAGGAGLAGSLLNRGSVIPRLPFFVFVCWYRVEHSG